MQEVYKQTRLRNGQQISGNQKSLFDLSAKVNQKGKKVITRD
jgi:hypothetical protein